MAFDKRRKENENLPRKNYEIKSETVRITGDGIESKVVTLKEAIRIANEMERDVIEINSRTDPPIVRIADFSKYMFELKKQLKQKNKKQPSLKEVQLSTNISSNDLQTKARKAKEFINDGHKVKVVLTMRGRELTRREESKKSIYTFIVEMEDVAVPESMPRDEGNKTIVIMKKK